MRRLNGVYTQAFNRRHRLVGHLFQGRYKDWNHSSKPHFCSPDRLDAAQIQAYLIQERKLAYASVNRRYAPFASCSPACSDAKPWRWKCR
jgi:hypothetical protein